MNILECAITRETEASSRLEQLAANAAGEELRELFTLLAAAEREHLQRLEALQGDVARHGAWDVSLAAAICPAKSLPGPETLAAAESASPDGYLDIARAEEASIAFYQDLATKAENPELRRLCRELAEEERRHLQQIAHIYDFVEGPKTFLAWGEFSNLRDF